jgi:hypothetical protein
MTSLDSVFNGFWNGFETPGSDLPTPLDQTPSYVNTVTLAFAGTAPGNQLGTSFLCKFYEAATIKAWAKALQSRGQRVLMSIIDNPTTHWDQLDIPEFARNATEVVVGDWGLDGVDIDSESEGSSADIFIEVLQEFRARLGPVGGGKILTYDTYLFDADDQKVLAATKDDLDWMNLMAYFLDYDNMIYRFGQYAGLVGSERVTIGVKPGTGQGDQSTALPEVGRLAAYQPRTGVKRGMMLYSLTLDVPYFTNQPIWTWARKIEQSLATPR